MGSRITLALGNLEVDWGANGSFNDHSELFQASDVVELRRRRIDEDGEDVDCGQGNLLIYEGLRKPLRHVVPRLELLGVCPEQITLELKELSELAGLINDGNTGMSYEELAGLLLKVDVATISSKYEGDYDFGEFFAEEVAPRLGVRGDRLELRRVGEMLENLSAHAILWLLSRNPRNLDLPLTWDFSEHVLDDWSLRDEHIRPLPRSSQFLIVTEGTSDSLLIQKAFQLRRPEIADFFYFVDTEAGFPFSGTGNLHRFCQGLARIGLQNQTIIVYDNDAAGLAQLRQTLQVPLPSNIRVIRLPDLPPDITFHTIGPDGEAESGVNGRAASIEAFLDLTSSGSPSVRWTSYVDQIGAYQGEIERKSDYIREFLSERLRATYDFSKLDLVLTAIASAAVEIAQRPTPN